ncbi:MAG: hypothetical protein O2809_07335 [Proteobacteria bacterium]|nr:hypothetical protein [Pseudomonadota bacterium]
MLTGVLSSAIFSHQVVAAQKPFLMAYYANYSGYFNANYVSNELKTAGHVIPEPSYPIPGIAKGYIKMDNNFPGNEQSTENTDLKNKLNGLSALSYGFLKPGSNGAVEFSDPWADLSNLDLESGHWFASGSDAFSLKMYDGSTPSNGGATQLNQCWGIIIVLNSIFSTDLEQAFIVLFYP